LRWTVPFIMVALVPVNALLAVASPLYMALLTLHLGFYFVAGLGLLSIRKRSLPLFMYVPYYLCNLNLALLLGFFKALTGTQRAAWKRTERTG